MFWKSLWFAAAATLLWSASAFAQRGVGESVGVAQQGAKPAAVELDTLRPTWAAGNGPRANPAGPYGGPCMHGGGYYYYRDRNAYGRGGRGYGYRWRR